MASDVAGQLRLFLASRSPRRRELLAAAGIPHLVVESDGRESQEDGDPFLAAEANARAKANGARIPGEARAPFFVLGADTLVVCDHSVLGKPRDRDDARRMITLLSGRRHTVVSGVALVSHTGGIGPVRRVVVGCAETDVWFRSLHSTQVEAYLDAAEWHDKAGGYGIQGAAGLLVERIEGEYANVVGLPLSLLVSLFGRLGYDLVSRRWVRGDAHSVPGLL